MLDPLKLIHEEMLEQDELWGVDRPLKSDRRFLILGEEVGEISRAILENDEDNMVSEIVQVGAVAANWLKAFNVEQYDYATLSGTIDNLFELNGRVFIDLGCPYSVRIWVPRKEFDSQEYYVGASLTLYVYKTKSDNAWTVLNRA